MPRTATLALLLALAGCSSGVTNSLDTSDIASAGGPPGSGPVCAYYSGIRSPGSVGFKDTFQRRACFQSAAACRAWFFEVQSRFPVSRLRKPCGS